MTSALSFAEIPTSVVTRDIVKMIVLWVTLLILHPGYSLVPVITAQLGQPVTFTCALFHLQISSRILQWYKQSAGDNLKLIVSVWRTTKPHYAPDFSESRLKINRDRHFINLTIVRTIQEDEGLYHCAFTDWIDNVWSGTYLSLKGTSQRTSNYTVFQWPTASGPVHPGDSVTLQCSVLADNKMCSRDHSVYWFRAGADQSYPNIIHTDRNDCERTSDSVRSCVYRLTKNVSSSDSGTYYCAVVTCGRILFGDGTKLDIQGTCMSSHLASVAIFALCALLVISLVIIAILICAIKKKKCNCCNAAVWAHIDGQRDVKCKEDMSVYSAVAFTKMKADCN